MDEEERRPGPLIDVVHVVAVDLDEARLERVLAAAEPPRANLKCHIRTLLFRRRLDGRCHKLLMLASDGDLAEEERRDESDRRAERRVDEDVVESVREREANGGGQRQLCGGDVGVRGKPRSEK